MHSFNTLLLLPRKIYYSNLCGPYIHLKLASSIYSGVFSSVSTIIFVIQQLYVTTENCLNWHNDLCKCLRILDFFFLKIFIRLYILSQWKSFRSQIKWEKEISIERGKVWFCGKFTMIIMMINHTRLIKE